MSGSFPRMEAPPNAYKAARELRQCMSLPEVLLWTRLRGRRLDGHRFRRQHPIGPYILDFYCADAKLAVEVDGYSHGVADRPERDARRDGWLARNGVLTLRIPARVVLADMDAALRTIAAALTPQSLRDSSPQVGSTF
jgi:very-short-patch-repair endonuclease